MVRVKITRKGTFPVNRPSPIVLHYVEVFSRLTETFIYDQLAAQREAGLDARVLAHGREDEEGRPFPSVLVVPRPSRLSAAGLAARTRRLLTGDPVWNRSTARMTAALQGERPGLVHAHFGWSGIYVLSAVRRARLPLVVTFYGRDAPDEAGPAERRRLGELFRDAARVLVLSARMGEKLARLGCPRDRIQVHHLGIDTGAIPYRVPEAPAAGAPVELVSVGRLVEKKGMDILLEALEEVAGGPQPIRLTIVGGGPLESALRARAGALPPGLVEWAGGLPHGETVRRMREAHLFVLASRTARDGDAEGTPTVLLEAQAVGLPVVSTLHEGIPECLPAANREWLAPEGDAAALAGRLRAMIEAPDRWGEIARRGREHVEAEFDSARLAVRALEIYREIVG